VRFQGIAPCCRNHLSNNLYFGESYSLEREGADFISCAAYSLVFVVGRVLNCFSGFLSAIGDDIDSVLHAIDAVIYAVL